MRGMFQARRADARRQAEIRIVGGGKRFFIILDADDRGDRAKNFLAADAHLVGRFREQCGLEIEARRFTVEALAAKGKLGAFLAADLDIVMSCLSWLSSTTGPIWVPCFSALSTVTVLSFFNGGGNELVVDALRHDDARRRRAALAGGEEGRIDDRFHSDVEIGVIQNHDRILAAHFKLEATIVLDGCSRNALAGAG
jgi:hypothetical protein